MSNRGAWPELLLALSVLAGCAGPSVAPRSGIQVTGAGSAAGGGAGALVDRENRWRGAAHGTPLGGVLGGSVSEISRRAARESVSANHPVAYHTTDGWQRVEAVPEPSTALGCRQVRERVYQDNALVREQVLEVC